MVSIEWAGSQSVWDGLRRSSGFGGNCVSVVKDFLYGVVLGDESEDFHLATASGAGQRVDLVDAIDELSPSFVPSSPKRMGLVGVGRTATL